MGRRSNEAPAGVEGSAGLTGLGARVHLFIHPLHGVSLPAVCWDRHWPAAAATATAENEKGRFVAVPLPRCRA